MACRYIKLLILLYLVTLIDARGGKKKKGGAGGGGATNGAGNATGEGPSTDPCQNAGLDCSDTCCLIGFDRKPVLPPQCAPAITDDMCAIYYNRAYNQLYIGFGSIFAAIIMIPIFIKAINCLLLVKFCKHYDDMSETWLGGYSICDCLSHLCPCCCFKRQPYEEEQRLAKLEA